ncbi:hypothetical protein LRX75_22600 [Rhizobium sp. DKSPLA3]|uniref:Uncharacterized protein n=1 Tax=Rhizobium quercicola TaxID=2901226 RepID=A0A9X1T2I1_9HYPH|nr:hypothetical protein [Rhizobium quercicola]MCD7111821.1 hypothetical protein [Rhizobium quercicola]
MVSLWIGRIAAALICAFGVAWLFDWVTGWWLGWNHIAICGYTGAIVQLGGMLGVLCTAYGFVAWAVSFFKSQQALQMIIGGVLIYAVPSVLPHYLGVDCAAPAAPTLQRSLP